MSGRAAEPAREFASGAASEGIQLLNSTSPILSRLRYQNKSTCARNPASYAGYFHISLFVYCFAVFFLSCIKANQNRDKTPWIVSLAHKVHFVSNNSMVKVFSNDRCETKIEAI